MVITIDLKRNPDVANLIADSDMGDKVKFLTSLKSKTPDLAEFTLDKAAECSPEDMKEHYSEDDGDGTDEESDAEDKGESEMPAKSGSQNTPGGSVEQDRMAAALTAQL